MKTIFILLIILKTILSAPLNCYQSLGGALYDLSPLESATDYELQVNSNITLVYNICRYVHRQCGTKFTFGNLFHNTQNLSCIKLSNSTKLDGVEYSLLNEEKLNEGIRMKFTGGDTVDTTLEGYSPISEEERLANAEKTFSLDMSFTCDQGTELDVEDWDFDSVHFAYVINMRTKHACPLVTLTQISDFVEDYSPLFMIVGFVIGAAEALFGLRFFKSTLFLFGFLTGFLITLFTFFSHVVTPDSAESTKWIIVLFAMVFGCCLGYITIKMHKVGSFLIGTWFGIIIGLLLYNTFLYLFDDAQATVFIVTIVVFAAMGGALAHKQEKYLIIMASGICGSYIAIRSISFMAGGFPNEVELIQAIEMQDDNYSIPWQFYVYLNAIISFGLAAIWFQIKQKRKRDKKKEENEFEIGEYIKNED